MLTFAEVFFSPSCSTDGRFMFFGFEVRLSTGFFPMHPDLSREFRVRQFRWKVRATRIVSCRESFYACYRNSPQGPSYSCNRYANMEVFETATNLYLGQVNLVRTRESIMISRVRTLGGFQDYKKIIEIWFLIIRFNYCSRDAISAKRNSKRWNRFKVMCF